MIGRGGGGSELVPLGDGCGREVTIAVLPNGDANEQDVAAWRAASMSTDHLRSSSPPPSPSPSLPPGADVARAQAHRAGAQWHKTRGKEATSHRPCHANRRERNSTSQPRKPTPAAPSLQR